MTMIHGISQLYIPHWMDGLCPVIYVRPAVLPVGTALLISHDKLLLQVPFIPDVGQTWRVSGFWETCSALRVRNKGVAAGPQDSRRALCPASGTLANSKLY